MATTPVTPAPATNPVTAAEQTVTADLAADVTKDEAWLKTNAKPLLIGAALGAAIEFVVRHFV